jgi:trigger factor
MPDVTTTVTELPESRVRVEAEVPATEVESRLQAAARSLGRDMKMPGFRKGKIPPPVVIQRVGREVVLDEAVRGALGRWYVQALDASEIVPIGEPDIDLGDLPAEGQPLTFTIEIGVRPVATLGEYKGLEVPRREPAAPEDDVDVEVEALRERQARLETVERAAAEGDHVVMDYVGSIDGVPFEGGEGRDQMIELGSGRLIPGFEEQIVGLSADEEREITVTFPDDYQADHLAGNDAQFQITLKDVREKQLPDLDDDFASDAAGFDTLAELREDIATKMREADEEKVDVDFREAVLDAVAANATVELPDALVDARAKELWERMLHSLEHQGITKDLYMQITGRSEDEVLAEARPDAEQALRREAVIAAVIEAEGIVPSDGDILDALAEASVRENASPEELRARLEKSNRLGELKDDLAQASAVDLLVASATAVPAPPEEPAAKADSDDSDDAADDAPADAPAEDA